MTVLHPIPTLIAALDAMTDDQVLESHRIVSRRAQRIRQSDPTYRSQYAMGMAASNAARKREDSQATSGTAA